MNQLEGLFEMSDIPDSCKEKGKETFSGILSYMFLKYQREALASIAITGAKDRKFVLFAASSLCANYIEILKSNGNEISLADNDINKKGMLFHGIPIMHFDDLKAKGVEGETILIATMHFMPIFKQLIENGIVNSFADVMPYQGQNSLEKEYIKGFENLYEFWRGRT